MENHDTKLVSQGIKVVLSCSCGYHKVMGTLVSPIDAIAAESLHLQDALKEQVKREVEAAMIKEWREQGLTTIW